LIRSSQGTIDWGDRPEPSEGFHHLRSERSRIFFCILIGLLGVALPLHAGTFVVTKAEVGSSIDVGTLEWAVEMIRNTTGPNTISFDIPGAGPHVFTRGPDSLYWLGLPNNTFLDGFTQPQSNLEDLRIAFNFSIVLQNNSTVRGIAVLTNITHTYGPIVVRGNGNRVEGNSIKTPGLNNGIYVNGSDNVVTSNTVANGFTGLWIEAGSSNTASWNTVSNCTFGLKVWNSFCSIDYNSIVGNWYGIDIYSSSNTLSGNTIQANLHSGLSISGYHNLIGYMPPKSGNYIFENGDDGILLVGSSNTIIGNSIGLPANGTLPAHRGNGRHGILIPKATISQEAHQIRTWFGESTPAALDFSHELVELIDLRQLRFLRPHT
jgi:parallel beta-helix repeat protein